MGLMNRFFRCIFALAVSMAIIQLSCSDKPDKLVVRVDDETSGQAETSPLSGVAQQLQDVTFSQSKGEKRLWKLEAKAVEQALDGPINLKNVEITYYSDDGRITVVTADTGIYDDAKHTARLEGNVKVRTSDGGSVNTTAVQWDQKKEVLTGDGHVTISKGNSTLSGTGFELRPAVESFKLYKVDGVLHKGDAKL